MKKKKKTCLTCQGHLFGSVSLPPTILPDNIGPMPHSENSKTNHINMMQTMKIIFRREQNYILPKAEIIYIFSFISFRKTSFNRRFYYPYYFQVLLYFPLFIKTQRHWENSLKFSLPNNKKQTSSEYKWLRIVLITKIFKSFVISQLSILLSF